MENKREITLRVNGTELKFSVGPDETLLRTLRGAFFYSVKFGCGSGECGACTVLLDGKPVRSCLIKAVDAVGKEIITLEGLSRNGELDPIQEAFIEAGAIQCGYCSPGLILSAKALLDRNPNPTEDEIRRGLNSVLCRCTGYARGVNAVQMAAAIRRGETPVPFQPVHIRLPDNIADVDLPEVYYRKDRGRNPLPPVIFSPSSLPPTKIIGKPQAKVDARKLAAGKPVFTDDFSIPGMLYAALLTSPYAHARLLKIDASKARMLPGVHAVLTWQDIPRIKYSSAGQSYPQPQPFDQVSLDNKVRHVGDRLAVVAAETTEIAQAALDLIDVDYEVLPVAVTPEQAMRDGAPIIHDETDTKGIFDRAHNIANHIDAKVGDVDKGFAEADHIFEGEYRTQRQQHAQLEPHVCITYLDENDRLVVRSSNQVPFHIRRMIAPLIGMPVKKIRVVKPRLGGGFGGKQELLIEDLCALLTLETRRPVRLEYTRTQEFTSARSRHGELIRYKVGIKDNRVTTAQLYLVGDTGAYATHGLSVNMVGGFKGPTLYNPPNAHFVSDIVYTNTPPAGAFRGYGTMQCLFGIEVLMEEIADKLGIDVVQFKKDNWIKVGDVMHLSSQLGEGREGVKQTLQTSGLMHCMDIGLKVTDFYEKRKRYAGQSGNLRRGIGMAVVMHGSAVAGVDMASAVIKMNDDGSFNLLVGASDLGTGADTVLTQIAAEVLDISTEDIITYSSDTDFTPFDKGAYASSTTYLSGQAVKKAAEEIKSQIFDHAALMLEVQDKNLLTLENGKVKAVDGRNLTLEQIALNSLHQQNQHQIIAAASHVSPVNPPPTAAQFAEIVVNTETGEITVERLLLVVDCGRVINPLTATGQVEGGMTQGLGFALTEEMLFGSDGQILNPSLIKYKIPRALSLPALDVMFVQTDEPSGPFGAKSVAEICIDGVAPAIASAIHNATGIWMRQLPYTKERVMAALRQAK